MSIPFTRFTISAAVLVLGAPSIAQTTFRVDIDSTGVPATLNSYGASLSADGRFVAFESVQALVPLDTLGNSDIYVRDRLLGTTEMASVTSAGAPANNNSGSAVITRDGRCVVFTSYAWNLDPRDPDAQPDIYLHDRQTGTTELVNLTSTGARAAGFFNYYAVSGDGRFVAFESQATNVVPGDTNGAIDVFVRDRQNATTERVSLTSTGGQAALGGRAPSISADGRFVSFQSVSTDIVPGDTNAKLDLFVRDRLLGTTERVSVDSTGGQANDHSEFATLSADGRFVLFESSATNLVAGDTNGVDDTFLHDRQTGATERISVTSSGVQANDQSISGTLSDDGRFVCFASYSTNLVPVSLNTSWNTYVRDRQTGTTELVSISSQGTPANNSVFGGISGNGRFVGFDSYATNLVPDDTDSASSVYVHDRTGGTSFTSLCDPGSGGVIGCPCGNPPSGAGRGCENSAATGGAVLAASGATFLSSDNLVFTTSGEKPTATSVLLQGTSSPAAGVVYGQGVRCVGGTLKRLFTKTASGGSVTAPNFAGGDPSVSARSAAKGNPISAGQSRWYLVFYRDPIVLGGCPASSTFNATQTGVVSWAP